MAFYMMGRDRGPLAGQTDSTTYQSGPSGRRSFTGRWDPQQSYTTNLAAGRTKDVVRPRRKREGRSFAYRELPPGTGTQAPVIDNPFGITGDQAFETHLGQINEGLAGEGFIGGYPEDYVSRTQVAVPYGSDNLSLRYWAYQKRQPKRPVFGQPLYRPGMEATYAANLSPDQVRSWQGFFQMNGFKTGPAGFWTESEMNAMSSFMGMANGVPGGGMTVEVLRSQIEANMQAYINPETGMPELASMLGAEGNELSADGTSGGGGGGGADMLPYTQTQVERQVTEFSLDDGLALLRADLARQLGRAPTESEVGRYVKGLNAAARADPTVITSVTSVDPMAGTQTTETTNEESSVNPEGMAQRFAVEANPEEREDYQGNRYFDAILSELGI